MKQHEFSVVDDLKNSRERLLDQLAEAEKQAAQYLHQSFDMRRSAEYYRRAAEECALAVEALTTSKVFEGVPAAQPAITIDAGQCGGAPCIRGMRIRVVDVLDALIGGQSYAEIVESFPYLTKADIVECLAFSADCVRQLDACKKPARGE